jgi:hypothetical protein
MKYTTEIEVAIPLKEFVRKMDNPDNMKHWQKGMRNYEHISGTPGRTGAKMKLNFILNKRPLALIETIVENKLPDSLHVTYDAKGMHNIQKNYVTQTAHGTTKWVSESEFLPASIMMRIFTIFMKGSFKKQSLSYLQDFKSFAETGASVSEG